MCSGLFPGSMPWNAGREKDAGRELGHFYGVGNIITYLLSHEPVSALYCILVSR